MDGRGDAVKRITEDALLALCRDEWPALSWRKARHWWPRVAGRQRIAGRGDDVVLTARSGTEVWLEMGLRFPVHYIGDLRAVRRYLRDLRYRSVTP